jgi:diguanylate cyclase (GGDEF)-like protein
VKTVASLVALVEALRNADALEDMLYALADVVSGLLGVERVTVRLLDETRARLMVAARAGKPVHAGEVTFAVGEGLVGWVVERGESLRTDDAEHDPRFVTKAEQVTRFSAFLGVPMVDNSGTIGVLSSISDRPFSADDEMIARLCVGIAVPWVQAARLRRLALVDPLTSALNRRGLESTFLRNEEPCVLLIDIDHFKLVNDRFGHAAGDKVLRAVAATLGDVARHADDVVRLGGEEFLVVLRGASLGAGARVAERARAAIAALRIPDERGEQIQITALDRRGRQAGGRDARRAHRARRRGDVSRQARRA